ncbi:hypothetical protein PENTCL1PPCAC_1764, partial [Pristionchus entomophagus]
SLSPTTPEARPKRRRFALTPECTPPNLTYMDRQFKTVKILGEGCYGVVNEVECRFSKEKFAIKIFKVDKLKNKSGLNYDRRNLQEVRTHISIPSHPNLVQFYSSWKENTYLCMQMELCEQSLYDYWKTKRILSQMDIEDVMKDSLNALACLSSLNLVHLDIKPANILRTEQGSYKLADFSVTVNLNKKDLSVDDIGSGRYAAPELFTNTFSPKADLYSLGISLSQVSVPSDAPLDEKKEWTALKDGRVPHRVTNALAGQLDSMVHSMLREYCARPSAQQLL